MASVTPEPVDILSGLQLHFYRALVAGRYLTFGAYSTSAHWLKLAAWVGGIATLVGGNYAVLWGRKWYGQLKHKKALRALKVE